MCNHYERQVRIIAPCCEQVFGCRLCHDEASEHKIDRFAIRSMVCMHCNTTMPVGALCSNSKCAKYNQPLSKFYCDICHVFTSDEIYHCDDCGMCRVGNSADFRHCSKCRACIGTSGFESHTCIEGMMESNCPICQEWLATSRDPIGWMKCGHAIHVECGRRYSEMNYTCPICSRTISDTSELFSQMEQYVNSIVIPSEFQGMLADIICRDCQGQTTTTFHVVYHQCTLCQSFNTRILNQWRPESDSSD